MASRLPESAKEAFSNINTVALSFFGIILLASILAIITVVLLGSKSETINKIVYFIYILIGLIVFFKIK